MSFSRWREKRRGVPDRRPKRWPDLSLHSSRAGSTPQGGTLQILKTKGHLSADTRNWETNAFKEGQKIPIEWLDCKNSENYIDDLRARGFNQGAARFARGEGMWAASSRDGEAIYFVCANGGQKQKGQIWRYLPSQFEGTEKEKKTRREYLNFSPSPTTTTSWKTPTT